MAFLKSLDISASGMTAQKMRLDVLSQNITNSTTTRTEDGTPYKRKMVVFEDRSNQATFSAQLEKAQNKIVKSKLKSRAQDIETVGGVKVAQIVEDETALTAVYDPTHPDANEEGYVMMPNVDTTQELIDMMSASRSYEANIQAFNATKNLANKALEIGR